MVKCQFNWNNFGESLKNRNIFGVKTEDLARWGASIRAF